MMWPGWSSFCRGHRTPTWKPSQVSRLIRFFAAAHGCLHSVLLLLEAYECTNNGETPRHGATVNDVIRLKADGDKADADVA